ncbi:MAG: histidine kinase dimerization/phosphoacceptor domain -containing protein [Bacteroidota bacterium]
MLIKLSNNIESLSKEFILNNIERTDSELDVFFKPIDEELKIFNDFTSSSHFDNLANPAFFNKIYLPILLKSNQISSILLADTLGNECMVLERSGFFQNRVTKLSSNYDKPIKYFWKKGIDNQDSLISKEVISESYNPKTRPWYNQAIKPYEVQWTQPYQFFTTKDPGITASIRWRDTVSKKNDKILAFDILLNDISKYTVNIDLPENAMIFVMSSEGKILGLPNKNEFRSEDSIKKYILKTPEDLKLPELSCFMAQWKKSTSDNQYFKFNNKDEKWWAGVKEYNLSSNCKFYIGVMVPESVFVSQFKTNRALIFVGLFLVLFIAVVSIVSFYQKIRVNQILNIQNKSIEFNNKKLNSMLAEKEVLIKEVHHRVKNNLQVVSSLLKLQSARINDEDARMAFKNSQDRVASMALLHEKLYKSKNLAEIGIGEYIEKLSLNLIESYDLTGKILTKIIIDDVKIDIDTLLSLGLMINELITNSLKYAFLDQENPVISISLSKSNKDHLVFVYSDNGIGFPVGFDLKTNKRMGFEILYSLTSQIDGEIEVYSNSGLNVEIVFPQS